MEEDSHTIPPATLDSAFNLSTPRPSMFDTDFCKRSFKYLAPTLCSGYFLTRLSSNVDTFECRMKTPCFTLFIHVLPVLSHSHCQHLWFSSNFWWCTPYKWLYNHHHHLVIIDINIIYESLIYQNTSVMFISYWTWEFIEFIHWISF